MEILFNFCYYVSFFFIPIAFYCLFLKNTSDHRFYNNRDWYYFIKVIFATLAVKKYQRKCRRTVDEVPHKFLENPKHIQSEISSDSQFIYGADQKGNSLSLRFTIRAGLVAEVFLCLRLENGSVYTFPGEKSPKLYSLSSWQWKTKNLSIEVLEPFTRLRLTYNGLLSNADHDVEHVHFNFIWTGVASPKFYPQNASTVLLADILAQETWKDGDWISLLGDERGYEQFGSLRGFVRGDSINDDLSLNLPSCRTRFWGTAEKLAVTRSLHLFVAGRDGSLINVRIKSLKKKCHGLKYGTVIMSNGTILPIAGCDIKLENLAQNKTLPTAFTVHVKVCGRVYKTVFHVKAQQAVSVTNKEGRGYQLSNVTADCDLNVVQGKSLLDFWYARRGGNVSLPPPLLVEIKTKDIPQCYVASFKSTECRNVKLTGGKGCSLAMLSCLECDDFTVPDGFVVTVNAFNRQLDENFNMKKAVAILDDICCGRARGNLEQACAETVKTFQSERILSAIVDDVRVALTGVKIDSQIRPTRWAVRSSAVGEDSEELSAAGQNETFLGCNSVDDVIKAISYCWASLYTYQSVQYRHQHGLPVASEMAVVVETMVPADSAGVMFTCHPSTANPAQMVITANYGLGESVVSGKSEPDTVILQRTFDNDLTIKSKSQGMKHMMVRMSSSGDGLEEVDGLDGYSITDNQALDLGRVGVFLEEVFGSYRDVEWAFFQNRLHLLQSRPVTTMNSWSEEELLHELDMAVLSDENVFTVANAGEVLPGAISPLSVTTATTAIVWAMQKNSGMKLDWYRRTHLPIFQNHLFIDVVGTIHMRVRERIDLTSKILDLAICGHPIINEKIHSLSLSKHGVFGKWKSQRDFLKSIKLAWQNQGHVDKCKRMVEQFDFGLDELRDTVKDMWKKVDSGLRRMVDLYLLHLQASSVSVTYQIIAMSMLAEGHQDFTVDHYNDIALLLSSCNDVISAEIPNTLSEISQILIDTHRSEDFVKVDPSEGRLWLRSNCTEASDRFERFLQEHGHRTMGEFDIGKATWAMNPSEVVKMIQANCGRTSERSKKEPKSVDEVINSLTSPKKASTRKNLRFITEKGRRAVGGREQTKSAVVKLTDMLRQSYRTLARKMALQGLIPDPDLIFHLTHHEVGQVVEGDERIPTLINKAQKRRKFYPKWDKLKFPEVMYGTPKAERDEGAVLRTGSGRVLCEGTPVCTGVIKARACVINDLSEIDQLRDGDILITFCTDIGWSPYFPMLSGIVTELGGLVSHGAVVAREYGLPCIVGAQGATRLFKTGDTVVLSGKMGTIELFEEPTSNPIFVDN